MKKYFFIFLKITAILSVFLVATAFLIALLYEDEIIASVKDGMNKEIKGELTFSKAKLSLIRNFPSISLVIENPKLDSYAGLDTTVLFKSKEFVVAVDFWSIVRQEDILKINTISLLDPVIHLIIFKDSTSNFLVFDSLDEDTISAADAFELNLEELKIINGQIAYFDHIDGTNAFALGINQSIKASLGESINSMIGKTSIDSLSLKMNGIYFLTNARLNYTIDLDQENATNKYIIKRGELSLNSLSLLTSGFVQMNPDESIDLDLSMQSSESSVKDFFSLIPNSFKGDYKDVQSEGTFSLIASTKGKYQGVENIYPSFDIDLLLLDGKVKYPGMPFSMEDINFRMSASDKGAKLENTNIQIPELGFVLNGRNFNANCSIKELQQQAQCEGEIKGSISLSDYQSFLPMDQNTSMSGDVIADVVFGFNKQMVESEDYEKIKLSGILDLLNVKYKTSGIPGVYIESMKWIFDFKSCKLQNSNMQLGKSDMQVTGEAINPLAIVTGKGKCKADFNVKGKLLNADEWLAPEDSVLTQPTASSESETGFEKLIELNVLASYGQIVYEDYIIEDAKSKLKFNDDILEIELFDATINNNRIQLSGHLEPIMAFASDRSRLKGALNIQGGKIDVIQFMGEDQNASTTDRSETAFEAPTNMDIEVNFKFDELKYDQWIFSNPKGMLATDDHELQLRNFSSGSLGGDISMQGVYNSTDLKNPSFDFKYDMKKIKFGKAFESVKTISVLAPIFKYIEGTFNTSIVCSGSLNSDMSPVYTSLNLNGLIETLDGFIKSYPPLEKVANKLGVDELKSISLQNTKNWVKIESGSMHLTPGEKVFKEIKMQYEGSHKIQGDMNYKFVFNIPKSKLRNSAVGNVMESGMNYIQGLASKANLELKSSTHINLLVGLSGKLLDPKIDIKLLSSSGQSLEENASNMIKDVASDLTDSLRKRAEQESENLKKKALEEAKKAEDSIRAIANRKIEEEKKKLIDKASNELRSHVDSTLLKKGKDSLDKELKKLLQEGGGNEVDDIKNKVKDWNPFKKKKN
ncbi:MAG: hypothetical protein IPM48_12925 [Saprospiraceae bacterium]|nr:hypothetical protein [Saprospiraceae bacterium]